MIPAADHSPSGAQSCGVGGGPFAPPPAHVVSLPTVPTRVEEYNRLDAMVGVWAKSLTEVETTRIAIGNRLAALTRDDIPALPQEVAHLAAMQDELKRVEHTMTRQLEKAMKHHPLSGWVQRPESLGVGLKTAGRLLAAIGNPYWNDLHNRPRRGPAELWAYCGYHVISPDDQFRTDALSRSVVRGPFLPASHPALDAHVARAGGRSSATPTNQGAGEHHVTAVGGVAPKRRKGAKANWNSEARKRAYIVADRCVLLKGRDNAKYRTVYEHARAIEDQRQGLTDKHRHNRAIRKVAKEILKDIWIEARNWHHNEVAAGAGTPAA